MNRAGNLHIKEIHPAGQIQGRLQYCAAVGGGGEGRGSLGRRVILCPLKTPGSQPGKAFFLEGGWGCKFREAIGKPTESARLWIQTANW